MNSSNWFELAVQVVTGVLAYLVGHGVGSNKKPGKKDS